MLLWLHQNPPDSEVHILPNLVPLNQIAYFEFVVWNWVYNFWKIEKGETGRVEYVKKVSGEVVVMSNFVEATVSGTPQRSIYSNSPSLTLSGPIF